MIHPPLLDSPGDLPDFSRLRHFALISQQDAPTVDLLVGSGITVENLADIPLREDLKPATDVLALIPFRQAREMGYACHDDGTPLRCLIIEQEQQLRVEDFLPLPPPELRLDECSYDISDADYAAVVQRIIDDEIGAGEGANFVIRRTLSGQLPGWSVEQAVRVFANLLRHERGTFWTFLVVDGDQMLIGVTPERHVACHGGSVMMHPISGTLRLAAPNGEPETTEQFRQRALAFLRDEKEVLELMMVVDEELKQMAGMCPQGGTILGPHLRRMTHLVHTEYELVGRSDLDVRELLRLSMFAATVSGSPVENACRIITGYESTGRGYYSSVLARIGWDEQGQQSLEGPILLRTAHVTSAAGDFSDAQLVASVGATLVRHSVPASEVAETRAKHAGLLAALGVTPARTSEVAADVDGVLAELGEVLRERNKRLSPFWMNDFGWTDDSAVTTAEDPMLVGKSVVLIAAEDNFVVMLAHVLRSFGMSVQVKTWRQVTPGQLGDYDIVVMGPGPGDPRNRDDARMARLFELTQAQLDAGRPLLAVCLGHQILASTLGLELRPKHQVFQGAQETLDLFGQQETVGFYNTFTAVAASLPGVELATAGDEVHALRGNGCYGLQFHAESILTPNGREILAHAMKWVVGKY